PAATTDSRSQSTNPASAARHAAIRSANTGADAKSAIPIPDHCAPCPGNTNTARPVPLATPRAIRGPTAPATTAPAATAPTAPTATTSVATTSAATAAA